MIETHSPENLKREHSRAGGKFSSENNFSLIIMEITQQQRQRGNSSELSWPAKKHCLKNNRPLSSRALPIRSHWTSISGRGRSSCSSGRRTGFQEPQHQRAFGGLPMILEANQSEFVTSHRKHSATIKKPLEGFGEKGTSVVYVAANWLSPVVWQSESLNEFTQTATQLISERDFVRVHSTRVPRTHTHTHTIQTQAKQTLAHTIERSIWTLRCGR